MLRCIYSVLCFVFLFSTNASHRSTAAGGAMLQDPVTGLIVKVIAGSNRITAYTAPDDTSKVSFALEIVINDCYVTISNRLANNNT